MGEYAAKFRPDIDLDEFERRLRAAAPASQPREAQNADPLAELARLVSGAEAARGGDPFEALFRAQAAIADIRHAPGASPAQQQPPLQAPHEPYFEDETDFQGYELRAGESSHAADAAQYATDPLPYAEADPNWIGEDGAPAPAAAPAGWAVEDDEIRAEPAPSLAGRRKVFYGMAAVLVAGVVGIGGTLALRGKSGGHEVVTIQADSDPAKIKPDQADNSAASSSQALFDRKDNAGSAKVVGSEEQPADLGATAKAARVVSAAQVPAPPALAPAAAPPPPAAPPAAQSDSVFPAPKKVKTVSVRADGSVIQGPDARPQLARGLPSMAGGFPANSPAAAAPPAAPTPPTGSTNRGATSTTEAALKTPAKPKPAKAAAQEIAGETGTFAVQLAGSPVESEARAAANSLSAKYASALNGHHATFVEAKVGDKTIYRVRVGHLTEDTARQMCTAIKGQGGNCFVAKN